MKDFGLPEIGFICIGRGPVAYWEGFPFSINEHFTACKDIVWKCFVFRKVNLFCCI